MEKPVVASPNVGRFSQATDLSPFNPLSPKSDQHQIIFLPVISMLCTTEWS